MHVFSLGSSVIDAWPLTRAVQDTMQVPHTHDRPVAQVLRIFLLKRFFLIKIIKNHHEKFIHCSQIVEEIVLDIFHTFRN